MKWRTNHEINNETVEQMISNIDKDLLIARLCHTLNISKDEILKDIEESEIDLLITSILVNRGITAKESIDKTFNNIAESIIDANFLVNAKKAADIITSYLKNPNAVIYIYADYDADGINSGYVMTSALREVAKCNVIVVYPNRKDGYGLSMEFCKEIVERHTNFEDLTLNQDILVITVDNGISKVEEVQYLKDNNIEVIVTDHHSSQKELGVPNCLIVDPHNAYQEQDDTFKHLCGCGVAFKVAQLVQANFNKYNMLKYTPYLAIATLSDVMPLTDENLAFIQYGLEIINSKDCPLGLKQLMKSTNIDVMTANTILWTVGPMLNACGRMGDTELASKLFFIDDVISIEDIVNRIIQVNERRKTLTKKAQKDLDKMNFDNHKVCILPTNEYPSGILGIIAGKVAEKFEKPSIVASESHEGLYHGSVRSFNGIDMLTVLEKAKSENIIESCGGHGEACVCGFKLDKLDEFYAFLDNELAVNTIEQTETVESEEKELVIDEIISLNHLNKTVYALVNMFPCDNRKYQNPTFALTDLEVVSYNTSKNNPNNIKFTVKQDGRIMDIWAWGFTDKYINELGCPNELHIAGTIEKSFINKKYSLNVVDIRAV